MFNSIFGPCKGKGQPEHGHGQRSTQKFHRQVGFLRSGRPVNSSFPFTSLLTPGFKKNEKTFCSVRRFVTPREGPQDPPTKTHTVSTGENVEAVFFSGAVGAKKLSRERSIWKSSGPGTVEAGIFLCRDFLGGSFPCGLGWDPNFCFCVPSVRPVPEQRARAGVGLERRAVRSFFYAEPRSGNFAKPESQPGSQFFGIFL